MDTDSAAIIELRTPLTREECRKLKVGDEVWISGIIWGVRDASLIRMIDDREIPDCDFSGGFFLHTAPSVRKGEHGELIPVSVGTTTSMRMDRFTSGCIKQLGGAGIIGKGGLSENSSKILQEEGGVYLSITGGAASLETLQIEAIEDIFLEDLMPECVWKFRVRRLGPLIVSMDSQGNSLYRNVKSRATERLDFYLKSLDT
jgi:L(+)-tartrate dehydratase beta subunit